MKFGIKFKLVALFLFLEAIIIGGISYYQYQKQWNLLVTQSVINKKNLSQQFVNAISLSIEGNNYGNILLPVFVNRLKTTSSLIYLEVDGISSASNKYQFSYHKKIGKIWRTYYPDNYLELLETKIDKLKKYSLIKKSDPVKINFLIQRAKEEKLKYKSNLNNQKNMSHYNYQFNFADDYFIDEDDFTLSLSLTTINTNGGVVSFVYDISEIASLKEHIIQTALIEFLILLCITLLLVLIIAHLIVRPIEELTQYLSSHKIKVDINNIPALTAKDEVGDLAREFKALISNTYLYLEKIEKLSTKDPLTDLFNRRYFDDVVEDIINRSRRYKTVLSFLFIDIDNFKKYNDNYGHNKGDETLKAVTQSFSKAANRVDDYCFRFGGEEFLVILVNDKADDGLATAELIRENIEKMDIEHLFNDAYNCITISIGVCSITNLSQSISPKDIIKYADNELYKAKHLGRNKVCQNVIKN